MIKKCIGCGVVLQDEKKDELGYTPDIKNDYCKRCFRLKNYGEKKCESIDEEKIFKKVNKSNGIAFFLLDFLNINRETIGIFKKIKIPKVLVISKCDTLRKDMKFTKIKNWLKSVYNVSDEIIFISNKNAQKNANIFKIMEYNHFNTAFIMGVTNAGKSTFINSLLKSSNIKKEIVVSNKPNTTLDFIRMSILGYTIYDTPGFSYTGFNERLANREIKPITYQIKAGTGIIINETINIYFEENNSVTLYLANNNVKRDYKMDIPDKKTSMLDNSDLVIPGLGFINIKNKTIVRSNIGGFEVRRNMSGEEK